MLTIVLPHENAERMAFALRRAGTREIGGVLMAEHTGDNHFTVREITVHNRGTFATFIRHIRDAVGSIATFFRKTGHDYRRFNYLGEWHSHPSFHPTPSSKDDRSMWSIVCDESVGATFAVLLVVKLDIAGNLIGTAHTYLPDGTRQASVLSVE